MSNVTTKSKGRRANVYIDDYGIIYILKDKNNIIKGKIPFTEIDLDSAQSRAKKIRNELKQLSKKNKIKKFNMVISQGIRMVKVFDFDKEVKLNADVDLLLKEEISKYIQPSENVNDYSIHYLKTGKTKQTIFLTSVVKRKILIETCTYAMQDKINIEFLTIPEIPMFEILKNKNGVNAIALYCEDSMDLRVLVCKNSGLLYANQISSVQVQDIPTEIRNLTDYVKSEYKESVTLCYLIGADDLELDTMSNIQHIEEDKEIDSKYHLLLNL